ncbi:unnamed protein product [Leuciscus chuanchicus]
MHPATECQELKVVDLYWGIDPEEWDSPELQRLRMKLLEECLKTAAGPCFVDRNRRRRSSTSCPDGQLLPPPCCRLQRLWLFIAEGIPLCPPPLPLSLSSSLHPGHSVEPAAGRPPSPSRSPSNPETGDPEMEEIALQEMVTAPLHPPEEGRVKIAVLLTKGRDRAGPSSRHEDRVLQPLLNCTQERRNWAERHDNGPKHTTKMTTALLRKLKAKVMEWPSVSPDLNPIEHLWVILKRKVEKHHVTNIHQLRDVILEEDPSNNLCSSGELHA